MSALSSFGDVSSFTDAPSGDVGAANSEAGFASLFGATSGAASAASSSNSGMNNNSLFAALGADATKLATGYLGAQLASKTVKANPASATTLILVVGGVAILFVLLFAMRR